MGSHQDLGVYTTPGCQGKRAKKASPVNDVEGVQVANGTGHLGSIKPGPGLQEPALPLQVEEELAGAGVRGGREACEQIPGELHFLKGGVWDG